MSSQQKSLNVGHRKRGSGSAANRQQQGSGSAANRQQQSSGSAPNRQQQSSGSAPNRQQQSSGSAPNRQQQSSGSAPNRQQQSSGSAPNRQQQSSGSAPNRQQQSSGSAPNRQQQSSGSAPNRQQQSSGSAPNRQQQSSGSAPNRQQQNSGSAVNKQQKDSGRLTVFVRYDQSLTSKNNKRNEDKSVRIYAPKWVEKALDNLSAEITKSTPIDVYDQYNNHRILRLPDDKLSLKYLVMLARNEPNNTNGFINFKNYTFRKEVILAVKDLCRQCVILAKNETTHYGGYPRDTIREPQKRDVYVADLIGLQFQQYCNTGRLVIVSEKPVKGLLDDMIYERVVGEPKKSYKEVTNDRTGRYILYYNDYFDTFAYKRFVAKDILLTGLAIADYVDKCPKADGTHDTVNFKFTKYGAGYFADIFKDIIQNLIIDGVFDGLKLLLEQKPKHIGAIELPFFDTNKRVIDLCNSHKIKLRFSRDDALKQTYDEYVTATTNCADAHAVTGNKMGFGSVDACIAENLVGKANKYSPIINPLISQQFIEL